MDSRPFGGTCALRGCDPKKVLVGVADALDRAHHLRGRGVHADGLRIDWPELIRFKRTMIEAVPAQRREGFARAGIDPFQGRARFVDATSIAVGDHLLEGRHVVIATGAKPKDIDVTGREHFVTSEQFLELDTLPARIVFVGGGFISFEFAHVAARAGAAVTILHHGQRPLGAFDPDLVDRLVERSRALGIDVRLGTRASRIDQARGTYMVHADADSGPSLIDADLVVHGAGRIAEIDDLNLDAAGVKWESHGVTVNEHLRSVSNPGVYAAGDAAGNGAPKLTPVAALDGRVLAENLLGGRNLTPDYSVIPSVVFTIPALARVGLSQSAARTRGAEFDVHAGDTSEWYSSRRIGETQSGFKVLVERQSGRILGAHVLGPYAEEMINLFAMAMRTGATSSTLKEMAFAYPTAGSDLPYML